LSSAAAAAISNALPILISPTGFNQQLSSLSSGSSSSNVFANSTILPLVGSSRTLQQQQQQPNTLSSFATSANNDSSFANSLNNLDLNANNTNLLNTVNSSNPTSANSYLPVHIQLINDQTTGNIMSEIQSDANEPNSATVTSMLNVGTLKNLKIHRHFDLTKKVHYSNII
jgi:hypothetical protein